MNTMSEFSRATAKRIKKYKTFDIFKLLRSIEDEAKPEIQPKQAL